MENKLASLANFRNYHFQKEAEVERFYANLFVDAKQHHLDIDILSRNLLIEVKFNRNIENDWDEIVRNYLRNNNVPDAFIFYEDITENNPKRYVAATKEMSGMRLTITFETYGATISRIPEGEYRKFERQWKRIVPNSIEGEEIYRRLYQLCEMDKRRSTGSFYTPYLLAKHAWQMITAQLGENFWQNGTWRIWDNCAGIGNLQYEVIPEEALQYTYLSDKGLAEVKMIENNDYFKGKCGGIFQFDWLEDNESKLPANLRNDIQNKNLKWLFFINPPYADSGTGIGKEYKKGVKFGNIGDEMKSRGMGQSANELALQFLYRIERDFGKRGYFLGLFSTPKWITKSSPENFRAVWNPVFCGGFMLNASEHFIQQKVKKLELKAHGHFPILFSLLDRRTKQKADWNQNWTYAEINKQIKTVGSKTFSVYDKNRLSFRDYFFPLDTGEKKKTLPVMASALIPTGGTSRIQGKVSSDFVGAIKIASVDFQDKEKSFFQSSLPTSHEVCITTANYSSVLIGYALYKSVRYDWTKNQDIFYAPYRNLTKKEQADCILYAILENKNNTATTTVETETEKFHLKNWFNPFDKDKFDWNNLSSFGKKALQELTNYCENTVQWRTLQTPYGNNKGNGVWLGLYQYRMTYDEVNKTYRSKFDRDYPNRDVFGFEYPDTFKQAIENLRNRVEKLAVDLCLTVGKAVERTRDIFLKPPQMQWDM